MRNRASVVWATAEIARRDPVIATLVERTGPVRLRPPRGGAAGHFGELAASIIYQQLAGKAAAAIHSRFLALFDGDLLSPEAVLALPEEALRGAGLSRAKAASIRDLAARVVDGTVPVEKLSRMPDEELIRRLSVVRGIGRWTAEMFLIFRLRRLDVWPVDDYGVRVGYRIAYGLPAVPAPKDLEPEGERFRPYRTVAAWYCWRAVELSRKA
jgi:3-methyladenine DNA glycosylase/8-oxoguanine DNA glycosylase